MHKYFVYSGFNEYPLGGAEDLVCTTETVEEATDVAVDCVVVGDAIGPVHNWAHVYGITENKIVLEIRRE